jgi:hypothetical protein
MCPAGFLARAPISRDCAPCKVGISVKKKAAHGGEPRNVAPLSMLVKTDPKRTPEMLWPGISMLTQYATAGLEG